MLNQIKIIKRCMSICFCSSLENTVLQYRMFKYLLLQQWYMGCYYNLIKNIILCFKLIQFVLNELHLWMFRLISPLDVTFHSTIRFLVYYKKCMLVTFFTHAFIYVNLNMSIHINIFHRNTIPQSRCKYPYFLKYV